MLRLFLAAPRVLALLLFLALPAAARDCQSSDKILLTGSNQGYYDMMGRAIAQVARTEGLDLCVQTTDHILDNVSKLDSGEAMFGIAQSNVAHDAWYGHPKRFTKRLENVHIVMPLYAEVVHILLRPHMNISHLGDLRGRKVGVGLTDSGTEYTARHILEAVGLQAEGDGANYKAVSTTDPVFCHSVHMLMTGELDALFRVSVVPSVDIQDALKANPSAETAKQDCAPAWEVKLLPFDHELTERLVRNGSYNETLILRSDYGQSESTLTVGVQALLLAGKTAKKEDVRTLARVIRFRHRAIDKALEGLVATKHQGHEHPAGNLPQLSLLNVPMATFAGAVHPAAQEYVYHWWRDSWVPALRGIIPGSVVVCALLFWKRATLGRLMERQPNLTFAVAGTLLIWLVVTGMLYHFEWAVNEHFNSFLRSLASTFLYLTSLSGYDLLTQDAQSAAESAKWVSVVLLGGFASPLLKQGLDALLRRVSKRLQGKTSPAKSECEVHVIDTAVAETRRVPALGDGELQGVPMAPGAD